MAEKRRGLGRGLGALIPDVVKDETVDVLESSEKKLPRSSKATSAQKTDSKPKPETVQKPNQKTKTSSTFQEKVVAKKTQDRSTVSEKKIKKPQTTTTAVKKTSASKNPATRTLKNNVSRETKLTSSTENKKKRADMGAALRNTTNSRRPVDFFFGEAETTQNDSLVPVPGAEFAEVRVKDIHPNRKQPRTEFDEQDMQELVHSIKEIGVLQPIVVRTSRENGVEKYELVMGERRWRASQRAGLETIPAIIRETQDIDLLRDALLENLHRSQLNPIEEAAAYQQLMDEFGATQEQLAQRIGRSRPQISNTIRLLRLPALVQRRVAAGVLSSGHARALLALRSQAEIEKIAQKAVNEGLSVRAIEDLVAASTTDSQKKRKAPQPQKHHERLDYIADAFADKLDTNVKIQLGARKGKMTIEFASVEDLNRIISVIDPKMKK